MICFLNCKPKAWWRMVLVLSYHDTGLVNYWPLVISCLLEIWFENVAFSLIWIYPVRFYHLSCCSGFILSDFLLSNLIFLLATEESKSSNCTSTDQPVVPVMSSSTTSNIGSTPSTPNVLEELKFASQLRKFSYNELKHATKNFRSDYILGQGGFGCVYKGWINENGPAPVRLGSGIPVAVKTLNHDGLQGHKEWLVFLNI